MESNSKVPGSLPPPFVTIEGIDNVREIGTFARSPFVKIKKGLIYRGGDPSKITARGKVQLHELGITSIIDLRSDRASGTSLGIDGVKWVHVPPEEKGVDDPAQMAAKLRGFELSPLETFVETYTRVLETGGPVFELIFMHLRDNHSEPCLIQCSAGKNRTGIGMALLLMFLGVHDDDIVEDYALSSVGLESAMPMLIAKFQGRNQQYRENLAGLTNMLSAKAETMVATLAVIRQRFGGVENYLKTHTSLQDKDLDKIRSNLLSN